MTYRAPRMDVDIECILSRIARVVTRERRRLRLHARMVVMANPGRLAILTAIADIEAIDPTGIIAGDALLVLRRALP